MEPITWNEVMKICKISIDTNTDPVWDMLIVTIRNKKMKHLYRHSIDNKHIMDKEMMLKLVNIKSSFIDNVIKSYINESKLESYFGEIKI